MKKKTINFIALSSGILSIISGLGYVLEKISMIELHIFYGNILLIAAIFFILLFITFYFFVVKEDLVEDLIAIYNVQILNKDGDAIITRKITTIVNGENKSPEFNVYSDGSKMKLSEMALKAWDENGKVLSFNITLDKPTFKKFEIRYPHSMIDVDNYTFSYQYFWKKKFNVKNDYYEINDNSKSIEFKIEILDNWNLQHVSAAELYHDGTFRNREIILKERENEHSGFVRYKYAVKKKYRQSKLQIKWEISY